MTIEQIIECLDNILDFTDQCPCGAWGKVCDLRSDIIDSEKEED